ncbi:MAG: SH3 domain-containing protein [Balneola sp.]
MKDLEKLSSSAARLQAEVSKIQALAIPDLNISNLYNPSVLTKISRDLTFGFQSRVDISKRFPVTNNFNDSFKLLASQLENLSLVNRDLSESFTQFALNQIKLTNEFNKLAIHFGSAHFKEFNGISQSIQRLSNSFIQGIKLSKQWDSLVEIDTITTSLISTTQEYTKESVTSEDLIELKNSIIQEMTSLIAKTRNEKVINFIFQLIAVISFLLSAYSTYNSFNNKSNNEVLQETKTELEAIKKDISKKIENGFVNLHKNRVANTNVNLRFSPKRKSKKIGIVKKDQIVIVLEIQHKWLLITYVDHETNEPKSGFVFKKYFNEKSN